jgi:RNA polymerase sigma factor (sigma-70 family)
VGAADLLSIEPMIRFCVLRLRRTHPTSRLIEVDELTAQAWLAAASCLERFNPALGVSFRTFAERRVWGHLRDLVSYENKYRARHVQLEHITVGGEDGAAWEPPARGRNALERLLRRERRRIARESIGKLPAVQRVVMLGSLDGETYATLAEQLGFHESYIPKLKLAALKRLHRMDQVKALRRH